MAEAPPIPARCAGRETVGGRVIPWINVRLADGGVDFRAQHNARLKIALERPLHPECAVYTSHACPVVNGTATTLPAGRKLSEGARGQACPVAGCDCGGWVPNADGRQKPTEPHPWFAVYADGFGIAVSPEGQLLGALLQPGQVRRVRLVSRPGEGRCWTTVVDALAGYDPPTVRPAGERTV